MVYIPGDPFLIPVNAWIIQTKEEADNILLHGGKIIVISEDIPQYLQSPQFGSSCLMANCLLPNSEAVTHYIEGDPQTFSRIHMEQLMEMDNYIYFITMLSAMINGIPLGFVLGTEEIEVCSNVNILNFFATMFGIHLGHILPYIEEPPVAMGSMERSFVPKNVAALYLNNLLTPQEYLYAYPVDTQITPDCLTKLIIELNPLVEDRENVMSYIAYFDEIRGLVRKANKVLDDPMVMA